MSRIILHLDMDAFYASIEQRDRPELRGKPVVVGGSPSSRGVVCAASYEARKFGIRSAMPSSIAGRLCPNGIFIPPRMNVYKEESRRVMEILASTGGAIEPMSIDEAYVELTDVLVPDALRHSLNEWKSRDTPQAARDPALAEALDGILLEAVPLGRNLKERIRVERRLSATVGIAANKLLAKLASDYRKPDGLTVIPETGKVEFLRPLPVRVLHGVGRVTEQVLQNAGVLTVGDLQRYPGDLRALVGSFGERLRAFAFGEDDRPLELGEEVKSISSEETFERDTEDRQLLKRCLYQQAKEISAKLQRRRLAACTVQVKLRYGDYTTLTRQLTLEEPITESRDLYRLGCHLLAREQLVCRPLRLLGLGASGLREVHLRQMELSF